MLCGPLVLYGPGLDFRAGRAMYGCNQSCRGVAIRGDFGVDARATHHVERGFSLGKHQLVPEVQGKVLINAVEASDEVVFERTNRTVGGIAPMNTGRDKLEVDGFFAKKGL